ncbi:hypothetical protein KDK77_02060 [bacterium]|nr:hypothetical protein [bacterium]
MFGHSNCEFSLKIAGISFLSAAMIAVVSQIPSGAPVWIFWFAAGCFLFFCAHIFWYEMPRALTVSPHDARNRQLRFLKEELSQYSTTLHKKRACQGEEINESVLKQIDSVCDELLGIIECIQSAQRQKVLIDAEKLAENR